MKQMKQKMDESNKRLDELFEMVMDNTRSLTLIIEGLSKLQQHQDVSVRPMRK